uniref:Uncharacterized protein n=1 Tax=Tetradesmus obliquus TaxID=3088 RepID=A0A383WL98_TETOB|eukprot:jgi/Sobl393_1/18342/SZX77939.1
MHSKLSCKVGHISTKSLAVHPCFARQVPCLTGRLHQRTAFQAAAQAEEAAAAAEPQQQLKAEQRQKQKQQQKPAKPGQLTQTRIKRRAAAWKDSSTPNTGLVGITQKSRAESAAACVVADLKTASLTRIVAHGEEWLPKAVNVINLATQMMNGQFQGGQQQQQQQAAVDAAAEEQQQQQRVLVFQPLKVEGVLVAPPVLPEGAVALYTYALPADHPALQAAMAARLKLQAADAGATHSSSSNGGTSGSSSSSSSSGSRQGVANAKPGVVGISGSSNLTQAARAIAKEVQKRGWVELSCYGGPLTTQKGIEAIMGARGLLHSWSKQDVAAVFLEFWKKESTQQQQQQQDGTADQQQQQQQQQDSQLGPLPFRCCTFLLVACAKNKPAQPVVPAVSRSS